jgi:hypothetical protein
MTARKPLVIVAGQIRQLAAGDSLDSGQLAHGSSFPASPATNEIYVRDDLGVLCQYDGTRWRGPLCDVAAPTWDSYPPWTAATTTHLLTVGSAIVLRSIRVYCLITTNNASNYWNIAIARDGTSIVTLNTASGYAGTGFLLSDTTERVLTPSVSAVTISITKSGSPSSIRISSLVQYQRIYT